LSKSKAAIYSIDEVLATQQAMPWNAIARIINKFNNSFEAAKLFVKLTQSAIE